MLGQKYACYEQAEEEFRRLFWFTYRKEMKICGEIRTDLGWGCLIRVGQMLLANSLKRYFENSSTPTNEENVVFGTFLFDFQRFWTIPRAFGATTLSNAFSNADGSVST